MLVLLLAGITFLHYSTDQGQYYFHVFYGELYLLPIILTAFWFGLRGALLVSATISVSYLPFIILHWQGLSAEDLDRILSLLMCNGLAVLTGVLKGREQAAQEKLLQTENLAIMGRSLAAAAHDMKSPLMLIGGFARQILKKIDDKNPARLKLDLIIQETEKMERMIRDMLDFSKPLILNLVRGDLDAIIRNSLTKVEEAAKKKNVSIEYEPNTDVIDIKFDCMRLEQVIVNLLQNGIEASPEGGTVTMTLLFKSPGNLILDVSDNGSGIPLFKRQQIFDPFFTTKKEGTGLGLPIVKKIVNAHGWSLQILDNSNSGTIFRINLMEANARDHIHK